MCRKGRKKQWVSGAENSGACSHGEKTKRTFMFKCVWTRLCFSLVAYDTHKRHVFFHCQLLGAGKNWPKPEPCLKKTRSMHAEQTYLQLNRLACALWRHLLIAVRHVSSWTHHKIKWAYKGNLILVWEQMCAHFCVILTVRVAKIRTIINVLPGELTILSILESFGQNQITFKEVCGNFCSECI